MPLVLPILLLCSIGFLTSCSDRIGSDELEQRHPAILEARVLVQQQDVMGAEAVLMEALRQEPEMALAHVELGMIYQSLEDSVAAIYHFQSYLGLRPDGERSTILRQVIEDEKRRLANLVGVPGSVAPSTSEAVQQLEGRLADAKQEIAELSVALRQAEIQGAGVSEEPPPDWAAERVALLEEIRSLREHQNPEIAPTTPQEIHTGRTYTVQSGDTLSRIAQQVYGSSSEWQKIYEANRAIIPNKNVLSPGLELILP